MKFLLVQVVAPLVLLARIIGAHEQDEGQSILSNSSTLQIHFNPNLFRMTMGNSSNLNYTIVLNTTAFTDLKPTDSLVIEFALRTSSPQFEIVEFNRTFRPNLPEKVSLSLEQLKQPTYQSQLALRATYIGHATIRTRAFLLKSEPNGVRNESLIIVDNIDEPKITIIRHEGLLDKIFMYFVIVFITISYINLGAQIDIDNVRRLIETPRIIFLGFLIGVIVMPASSWIAGHVFFNDQPMYRIGSFIYACGPAASASVLWTVMFDADKELALGLQIASTVGALIIMPTLLFALDKSIDLEGQYTIKVPYGNLARTLIVLLVALLIGSRIVGHSKRAKQISQKIFRPLTMFVLLFIIVFSSIVYWYIYRMFDWYITAMALTVTSATYILSGLLGYLIHRDIDHMITISISSTYRNSGIAFAALVVAFQPPDIFIAYVPCLTQVVTTSLIGLVLYSIKSMRSRCHKRIGSHVIS